MRITAVRQIAGDYGVLRPGQTHHHVADHIAADLIKSGLAVEAAAAVPAEMQVQLPSESPVRGIAAEASGPGENKGVAVGRRRS